MGIWIDHIETIRRTKTLPANEPSRLFMGLFGKQQGWIEACAEAVAEGNPDWLSLDGEVLTWLRSLSDYLDAHIRLRAEAVAACGLAAVQLKKWLEHPDLRPEAVRAILAAASAWNSPGMNPDEIKLELPIEARSLDHPFTAMMEILRAVKGLHPDWQVAPLYDLIGRLADARRSEPAGSTSVQVNGLLVFDNKTGRVTTVQFEKFTAGFGELYLDPSLAFLDIKDQAFQESLRHSRAYAERWWKDEPKVDVRWRLVKFGTLELESVSQITGNSLGLAFGLGLHHLFQPDLPHIDFGYAVTGGIDGQGKVESVTGFTYKLDAAIQRGLVGVLIPNQDQTAAREGYPRIKDRLHPVKTVHQASEIISGLIQTLKDYVEQLIKRVSDQPGYMKQFPFERIRQRVRVSTKRKPYRDEMEAQFAYAPDSAEAYQFVARETIIEDWDDQRKRILKGGKLRAIILANPGYGKTWLLRYEACRLASELLQTIANGSIATNEVILPIFLHLNSLAQELQTNGNDIALALRKIVALAYKVKNHTFLDWIIGRIENGKCLLLLDAFDEVRENQDAQNHRKNLKQVLENYLKFDYSGHFLITSRITGYQGLEVFTTVNEAPRPELELVAFDWEMQVKPFVSEWFHQDSRAVQLLNHLKHNQQLRGLTGVPLLLSLICWIAETDQGLPENRIALYQKALEKMLLAKYKDEERDKVAIPRKLKQLEAIAFRFSGLESGRWSDFLPLDEVLEIIRITSPDKDAESEFKNLSEVDGILIEAGAGDVVPYMFLHRTFHEYLAAKVLARHHNCGQLLINAVFNIEAIPEELELLPMTLGLLDDTKTFYQMLSDLPEGLDFKSLRIQARGLQYGAYPGDTHMQHLIDRWVDFVIARYRDEMPYRSKVLNSYIGVSQEMAQPFIDLMVTKLRNQSQMEQVIGLILACELVRWRIPLVEELLSNILGEIRQEDMVELPTEGSSFESEIVVDQTNLEVNLEQLFDKDPDYQGWAADALGNYKGDFRSRVVESLLIALQGATPSVQGKVALALGKLGDNNQLVLAELRSLLGSGSSEYALGCAALALIWLGDSNTEGIVEGLLGLLKYSSPKYRDLKVHTVEALNQFERSDVVERLLEGIEEPDPVVRESIQRVLTQFARKNTEGIIDGLMTALQYKFVYSRLWGSENGLLYFANRSMLITAREITIKVLGQSGRSDLASVVDILSFLTIHDEEVSVRDCAMWALVELVGVNAPGIGEGMLRAMKDINKEKAVKTIYQFSKSTAPNDQTGILNILQTPGVVRQLLTALKDEEFGVRYYAKCVLEWPGIIKSKVIMKQLCSALRDNNPQTRVMAALTMVWLSIDELGMVKILLEALQFTDYDIQAQAAAALNRLAKDSSTTFIRQMKEIVESGNNKFICWKAAHCIGYYMPLVTLIQSYRRPLQIHLEQESQFDKIDKLSELLPVEGISFRPDPQIRLNHSRFLSLIAGSMSLSIKEKAKIIEMADNMTQLQFDELTKIFKEERESFTKKAKIHSEQILNLRLEHFQLWIRFYLENRVAF